MKLVYIYIYIDINEIQYNKCIYIYTSINRICLRQGSAPGPLERWGAKARVPVIFSGFFAESVQQSSFRDLGTKSEPKRANRDWNKLKMEQKEEPTRPKWKQKGTKRVPTDAKVVPKSCLGAFEILGFLHSFFFFVKRVKTVTAHLQVLRG